MELAVPINLWRRILAHLTTPAIVGIFWAFSIPSKEENFAENLIGAIGLCYIGWLLLGIPGALFRPKRERPALVKYAAIGALLGLLPWLFLGAANSPSAHELWMPLAGALAGGWYWACAYWTPSREAKWPGSSTP